MAPRRTCRRSAATSAGERGDECVPCGDATSTLKLGRKDIKHLELKMGAMDFEQSHRAS